MKCDQCGKDCAFTDLQRNGRRKHYDTLFRIRDRPMMVCRTCLHAFPTPSELPEPWQPETKLEN